MIGIIGHLLILSAFVATIVSGIAYFLAAQSSSAQRQWLPIARTSWTLMVAFIAGASAILFHLLLTHQFQYNYVYSYTSRDLSNTYLFSAFWAGQEGSFLLWIFYTGLVGFALMFWARRFEAPAMAVIAFCQVFLISMVVGLKLGPVPVGSSPFMLLAERFPDAPMLQTAGYIPPDGNGLNDLLKNWWMVIHPPTLFIGFASMVVPFAFAVAGLWKKQFTQWVRPALPFALVANIILFLGIAKGGYWAYITLSFGGYWAWDPVENSSLVPWLISVAAIHTMVVQKRSGHSQKAAILLSILAYMFVIYSTFLTRSGILGDISVHSFVDLGLNNQLLIWIIGMGLVGFGLFAYRYRELPTPAVEPRVLSREFMIFSGAMVVCALAAVIILGTSAPIFGRIFQSNPSAVPIDFYNKWSLPLAVLIALLAGIGQVFWWNRMNVAQLNRMLVKPLSLSFACTAAILILTPFVEHTVNYEAVMALAQRDDLSAGFGATFGQFWEVYSLSLMLLMLTFASFFAFFGNWMVLWRIGRGNLRLAGGSIAHIGMALMLFGIISSSGFNSPIVDGTGVPVQDHVGTVHSGERDNFIINRGETKRMQGYEITYSGQEMTPEGYTSYVLDVTDPRGRSFTARPTVYFSDREQWIQHPHVKKYIEQDLFIAVAPSVMFEQDHDHPEAQAGELFMMRGDSVVIGHREYALVFDRLDVNPQEEMIPTDDVEIAVAAAIRVTRLSTGETRTLRPVYIIMQQGVEHPFLYLQSRAVDWNLSLTFAGLETESGSIRLIIEGVAVTPDDWLVVHAYRKPFISMLWFGVVVLMIGFGLSIYRRIGEQRHGEARSRRDDPGTDD